MSQLADIHSDIGALQAQMDNVIESQRKIENIVTTVALHDERIKNVSRDLKDHAAYIEAAKRRHWTFTGGVLAISSAGSALASAVVNFILIKHP